MGVQESERLSTGVKNVMMPSIYNWNPCLYQMEIVPPYLVISPVTVHIRRYLGMCRAVSRGSYLLMNLLRELAGLRCLLMHLLRESACLRCLLMHLLRESACLRCLLMHLLREFSLSQVSSDEPPQRVSRSQVSSDAPPQRVSRSQVSSDAPPQRVSRSQEFIFKRDCLFCGDICYNLKQQHIL